MVTVKREMRIEVGKYYFVVDSEIARAMIQKQYYGFSTFVGVTIGEIQEATKPEDWYWIEGKQNIADVITKGRKPLELNHDSDWQQGPAFLQTDERDWPIRNCYSGENVLPEQVVMSVQQTNTMHSKSISNIIDIKRYSNYVTLLKVELLL